MGIYLYVHTSLTLFHTCFTSLQGKLHFVLLPFHFIWQSFNLFYAHPLCFCSSNFFIALPTLLNAPPTVSNVHPTLFSFLSICLTLPQLCFKLLPLNRERNVIGQLFSSEFFTWMSVHWLTRVAELRFETWEGNDASEPLSRWSHDIGSGCGIALLIMGGRYVASMARFSPGHDWRGVARVVYGARQCDIAVWLGVAILLILPVFKGWVTSGRSFWKPRHKSKSAIFI